MKQKRRTSERGREERAELFLLVVVGDQFLYERAGFFSTHVAPFLEYLP